MQTRRQFLTSAGAFTAATVFAPQVLAQGLTGARSAARIRGGRFSDGLVSGDPTPNGITLWTRVDGIEGSGSVVLEVARDRSFRRVVTRESIPTSAALNHTVKARVAKLDPYEQYYYRFSTATEDSPVGRFRTALPADSREPVSFAFFSCQDYTHGYYNAHELMARDDYDFVVCLGDYIYAESYHSKAGGTGVRDDRIGRTPSSRNKGIVREAITYRDYLDKYSLYRSDPALRAVHAKFPMVMLWDDHEIQDNYAGKPSDGGLPAAKRFAAKRKAAATKAFFTSMPAFPNGRRLYRTLQFGRTLDLVIMDQRRYRADQPCDDGVVPPCADWNRPRDLLGRTQMAFVQNQLQSSDAAWKVLANEVTIMPTKVLGGSFFTYDTWQGYPQEREQLLTFIRDKAIKDVVFITGDIHTFITGDVRTRMGDGETVAVEFVGGSMTSVGLGELDLPAGGGIVINGDDANPKTDPAIINALRTINPWVKSADFDHHGFARVRATEEAFDCELVRLETIKKRSRATLPPSADFDFSLKRGQTSIVA